MPTADQHRRKAARNREFLQTIAVDDHPEWAATVAFYTALHVIERLRRASGDGESAGHADRIAYVKHRHPDILPPFRRLYHASSVARYRPTGDFFAAYTAETVRDQLIGRDLAAVGEYVERTLTPPTGGTS